jgi:hypothetical protein
MLRSPLLVPIAAIVTDQTQFRRRGDMQKIEPLNRHDDARLNLAGWNAAIHCARVAADTVEVSSR